MFKDLFCHKKALMKERNFYAKTIKRFSFLLIQCEDEIGNRMRCEDDLQHGYRRIFHDVKSPRQNWSFMAYSERNCA